MTDFRLTDISDADLDTVVGGCDLLGPITTGGGEGANNLVACFT